MVRLESMSAPPLCMGLLGTMYAISGALSTTPSLCLPRPYRSFADFLLAQWVSVRWCWLALGLGLVVEVSVLVVTQLGCSESRLSAIGMRLD